MVRDDGDDVLRAHVTGRIELDNERWKAHREAHNLLAASLAEYKAAANEWRATLADLRSAGISRAEYASEHRALATRLDVLERLVEQSDAERAATRAVLGSIRNILLLGFTIMGGVIGLLVYLRL